MTLLYPYFPLGLNGLEVGLGACFLTGLFAYLRHQGSTVRESLIATLLVSPVVVITVAECTQFMTMDEWGISAEFMLPDKRGIHAMSYAWFFTGGALIELPIIRLAELIHIDQASTRMLLKAVWWLSGNIMIAAITVALLRLTQMAQRLNALVFSAIFAMLALLPTVQLALKTVNYDLFSSALGALAVLIWIRRVLTGDAGLGRVALLIAIFAAQEKLTAGPVLGFVIVAEALVIAYRHVGLADRVLAATKSAALAIAIAFAIPALSLAIYRLLGPATVPDDFWEMVVAPLSSWGQIPLGLLSPLKGLMDSRRWLVVGAAVPVGLLFVTGIAAACLPAITRLLAALARIPTSVLAIGLALLAAAVLVAGVVGTETITAYWDPFHPASLSGSFMQRFSEVVLHTGAKTLLMHFLGLVLYAFAVIVAMIPTTIWLFFLLGLICCAISKSTYRRSAWMIAFLLALGALFQPLASALAGMPFANRYFNLSIALLVAGLILTGVDALTRVRSIAMLTVVSGVLVAALVAEAAPFRPTFAAFRPFWLSYGDAQRAEPGRLNASWMGWGEEVMTGGKMLETACLAGDAAMFSHPCDEITLYIMNAGLWLPGPRHIHLGLFANVKDAPPLDDKSFYIVDRLYLIQDVYNIPQIQPDFAVSFRGYVLAWIFRGDRLRAAGYSFGRAAFQIYRR